VLDLKTERGRRDSERLIATADAIVQNFSSARASAYGLDREQVAEINPRAVWCSLSAFGSDGPNAELKAFDLVAQALSGLLLADVRVGDRLPHRAGGIAMADFTAGLLAAVAVLAGLVAREQADARALGLEVSLLGAALAVQTQRFVSVEELDGAKRARRLAGPPVATPEDLASQAARTAAADELEPYYRAYRAADGFFVLACLNEQQRRLVLSATGCRDPHVADPQAPPATPREREERVANARRLEQVFATRPASEWVESLRKAGVPAAEVRLLEQLFDDPQVEANGLLARLQVPGVGAVRQLGSLFKMDGRVPAYLAPPPGCGEHTAEILARLPEEVHG
jgi:crotonobetainyl-CoA:carnitine CoA-transferase CaiB-like acyl-CoA transferase